MTSDKKNLQRYDGFENPLWQPLPKTTYSKRKVRFLHSSDEQQRRGHILRKFSYPDNQKMKTSNRRYRVSPMKW